jgi:uncharacterized protein YegP (UPF0339 family)
MYFDLFKSDATKQWHWRLMADNNKSIAISGEGYNNKQDAIHGIKLVKDNAATLKIYDHETQTWLP